MGMLKNLLTNQLKEVIKKQRENESPERGLVVRKSAVVSEMRQK